MRKILFRGFTPDENGKDKVFVNGEWIKGQWVQGSYWELNKTTYCFKEDYERDPGNTERYIVFDQMTDWGLPNRHLQADVIPETVGQYTGLTDKNGTKIFEGDIFKFPDEIFESYYTSCGTEYNSWEVENYGVVGFCEELGRFDFVDYKFNENAVEADLHENRAIEFYDFVSDLEIIGNIHDNPELLKGGAE